MESKEKTVRELPELRHPDLIFALAGWSDAAEIATETVLYLVRSLSAVKFAHIGGDEFYNFSIVRPEVTIDRGLIAALDPPHNDLFYWKNNQADHDLVLFHGIEPHFHWQKFVDAITDLASALKVRRIYALGGLYDSTPHTREARTSGVVNMPNLLSALREHNIEPIIYQGPSSFHSLLLTNCAQINIEAISLWGHAPFYVRVETNPMVCLGLAKKLAELLDIEFDLEELRESGEHLRNMLDRLLADNDELQVYVKKLEQQYEIEGGMPAEQVEGADRIIREVEDFLRNQRRREET